MKIYNWLFKLAAKKILPSFLKGYRTMILGWAIFLDGSYDKFISSGIPDDACTFIPALCAVTAFLKTGGLKMITGLVIQLLRADTDTELPVPDDKNIPAQPYL